STASFLATKLCTRFWGYSPPASLVNAVAATYLNNGSGQVGDIKAMLRTLFANVDPMTAPFKYKRPYHLMCSILRTTSSNIITLSSLRSQLGLMGQIPFYWGPPDGYPDALDSWVGLILPRWNFAALLANNSFFNSTAGTGIQFVADTFLNFTSGQT